MSLRSPVLGYMTRYPFTLRPSQALRDARDLFVTHDITIAPVVDEGGRLCGVVTATDLVSRAPDLDDAVDTIMTREPIAVHDDTTVASAASLMTTCDVHHLVVIDPAWHPVGVISAVDIVTAMADSELPQPVEWFMSDDLVTVGPEATARETRDVLEEAGVSAAVVLDDGEPVGAISRLGLLRAARPEQRVGELMEGSLRAVPGETSLTRVARIFAETGARRVLVTDEDEEVAGIVTATDLARFAGRIVDPEED